MKVWQVRKLKNAELYKRGCLYCLDMISTEVPWGNYNAKSCPHEECPYHVLDKYETYNDFMKSEDSKILVDEFFDSGKHEYRLVFKKKMPYSDIRMVVD